MGKRCIKCGSRVWIKDPDLNGICPSCEELISLGMEFLIHDTSGYSLYSAPEPNLPHSQTEIDEFFQLLDKQFGKRK